MLQISTVQLKALLNTVCKDIDNASRFLLSDRWLRWWATRYPTSFTSAVNFKVLDQLENLTPLWKCVETRLPSVPCLNNPERLSLVICLHTKDLLLHLPSHDVPIFCLVYQNSISQQLSEKRTRIKSTGKIWEVATLFQQWYNTPSLSIHLFLYLTF